jgi:hypothetical protein
MKKWIKNNWLEVIILIVFCLFCFLLSCCGSVKVADSVDVEVRDQSKVDVVATHEELSKAESAATVTVDEYATISEEVVEVVYDTEKPVDAETGKPPVQRETVKKKTIVKGKQVQEQTIAATEHAAADSTVDKTLNDVEVEVEMEHEETPQKPAVAYWFYILLIVVVGAGAWFLGRKLF